MFHFYWLTEVQMSGSHLFNYDIIDKLCLKIPYIQLLRIPTSIAQFQPSKRSEERRHALPGPNMKPTAWQALVLAMALVLSVREVAPAIYDRTTATFPSKKPQSQASVHANIKSYR